MGKSIIPVGNILFSDRQRRKMETVMNIMLMVIAFIMLLSTVYFTLKITEAGMNSKTKTEDAIRLFASSFLAIFCFFML